MINLYYIVNDPNINIKYYYSADAIGLIKKKEVKYVCECGKLINNLVNDDNYCSKCGKPIICEFIWKQYFKEQFEQKTLEKLPTKLLLKHDITKEIEDIIHTFNQSSHIKFCYLTKSKETIKPLYLCLLLSDITNLSNLEDKLAAFKDKKNVLLDFANNMIFGTRTITYKVSVNLCWDYEGESITII